MHIRLIATQKSGCGAIRKTLVNTRPIRKHPWDFVLLIHKYLIYVNDPINYSLRMLPDLTTECKGKEVAWGGMHKSELSGVRAGLSVASR
jgi:hypothetical protein